MNKISRIIPVILMIAVLAITFAGCNTVKKSKEYNLFIYDATQGDFVECSAKITFDRKNYATYNAAGEVSNIGEFSTNEAILSLVPDKIGANNSQIAATTSMYVYNEFLVDPAQTTSRVAETLYEDRDELEGIYAAGYKLYDGNIYESVDGSNTDSSFTEKAGTYEINRNKDFIVFYNDNGTVDILLKIKYTDNFGYKVTALAASFFSYKKPSFRNLDVTNIELKNQIFRNTSTGGSANYNLTILSYPKKEDISEDITYSIVGVNNNASISGSTLSFTGTGSVLIEYTYGNLKGKETVYIVDNVKIANLTVNQRTYNVGDIVAYDDVLAALCNYSDEWFTYESISSTDEAKASCSNGNITFKLAGTMDIILTARYVLSYDDGVKEIVEIEQTVSIIIEP